MKRRLLKIRDPQARKAVESLRRGHVAIDCGANVGNVTAVFAARHADVFAFEPNPIAYEALAARFAGDGRVRCSPAAVTARDGDAKLYLHRDAASDPLKWSAGSSLFADKGNVDADTAVDVETVDLSRFLDSLGRPVQVLKLDVEGAEIEVLERLLDTGRLREIAHVLVEMHDNKIPSLERPGAELRARLAAERLDNVLLDWV
jgi:FkbM family methyltransferase